MYCQNCGKAVAENAAVCLSCGALPRSGNQFCPGCATPTQPIQVVCVKCGAALNTGALSGSTGDRVAPCNPPRDPVLMAALSGCCIAGLGQIVLGQVAKGVVIMLGSMVIGALTMGVGILVTWPAGAVDAYMIAKKLKEGRSVGQWEFF